MEFTDNANAVNDDQDRNADYIGSVSPGVTINGSGGRLSLDLALSRQQYKSFLGTTDDSGTTSLLANGRGELYDRVAFLDFNSSISRQIINPAANTPTVDNGSSSSNRTTVRTASLQPYFLHHFGTYLETQSRYNYTVTQTQSDTLSDTRQSNETFTVNSGRYFSTFTFSGNFSQDRTTRDQGQPHTVDTTAVSNYRLRVNRFLSLTSSLGWRRIDDSSFNQPKNHGLTWSAGFSTRPNSQTSLDMSVGKELNQTTFNLNSSYALSSRTSVTATYTDSITTSQQLLNNDLNFLVNDGTGTLIDSRTGLAYDPTNANFGFQTSLFRSQALNLGASATRRRNTYQAGLQWERRTDQASDTEQLVYSGNFSVNRQINPRLSGNLSTTARRTDFGTTDSRVDMEYSWGAGLSYRVTATTNASLRYSGSRVTSSLGQNNYHDNVLTVSLRHNF